MKNYTLVGMAKSVPYYPRLGVLVGVVPALVVVQLDFLTGMTVDRRGEDGSVIQTQPWLNGFYKYLSPPAVKTGDDGRVKPAPSTYSPGDSWCEWLGCSPDVFQTAFQKIGVPYSSIKKFNEACKEGDPFLGKFYISVYDHNDNLTYYYRNHGVVDQFLCDFAKNTAQPIENKRKEENPDPEKGKTPIRTGGKPRSGQEENPDPLTEITPEITTEITPELTKAAAEAERTESVPAAALLNQDQNPNPNPNPKPACSNTAACQLLVEPFLKNESDVLRWAYLLDKVDHGKLLAKIKEIIVSGQNPYVSSLIKWRTTVNQQSANQQAAEVQARLDALPRSKFDPAKFKTLKDNLKRGSETNQKGV